MRDDIERIVKDFNPLLEDGAGKALYSHKDEILIRILIQIAFELRNLLVVTRNMRDV